MIDVERNFPGPFLWFGTVVNREDPEGLYRIKARIPGQVDETDWAAPFGFATGNKRGGGPIVPPLGAPVAVFWFGGHINGIAGYFPGVFFRGKIPSGNVVSNDGKDCFVWQNDRLRVEVDARTASAGLRITNLQEVGGVDGPGTAVSLELDLATGQAEIMATAGLKLRAIGQVDIIAPAVTINGRPVAPGSKPI